MLVWSAAAAPVMAIAGDGCGDDATPAAAAAVARPPPPPRLLGDLVDVCGDWCNGAGVVDGSRDGGDARGGLADDTRGGVSGLAAGGSGAWLATPSSLLSVGSAVSVATGCSSSAASAAPSDDDGGGGDGKRKAAVAADTAAVPAGRTPSPHRRAAAPSSAPAEGRGEPPPRSGRGRSVSPMRAALPRSLRSWLPRLVGRWGGGGMGRAPADRR